MGRRSALRLESPDKINELKFELCRVIDYEVDYLITGDGRSRRGIAAQLGTTEACLSRVVNKKTKLVSFDQLFRFLVILKPDVRMLISTY